MVNINKNVPTQLTPGPYNILHLKKMCKEAHLIISAWGEDGSHLGQDEKVLALLKEWDIEVHA
jgi:hypothetical protein